MRPDQGRPPGLQVETEHTGRRPEPATLRPRCTYSRLTCGNSTLAVVGALKTLPAGYGRGRRRSRRPRSYLYTSGPSIEYLYDYCQLTDGAEPSSDVFTRSAASDAAIHRASAALPASNAINDRSQRRAPVRVQGRVSARPTTPLRGQRSPCGRSGRRSARTAGPRTAWPWPRGPKDSPE
jgi:hypothetical protein